MFTLSRFMLCCTGAMMLSAVPAKADGDWTFDVIARDSGKNQSIKWTNNATSKITKPWKICVLLPLMKNSYWVAGDYGMVQETKRDGLRARLENHVC